MRFTLKLLRKEIFRSQIAKKIYFSPKVLPDALRLQKPLRVYGNVHKLQIIWAAVLLNSVGGITHYLKRNTRQCLSNNPGV